MKETLTTVERDSVDGVIVVPSEIALGVAQYAYGEHDKDTVARVKQYEKPGLPFDKTLE